MRFLSGFSKVGFLENYGLSDPLTKCYGKYGCFTLKYPWYSSHRVVNLFPKNSNELGVNIYLFTRKNRRSRQELFIDDLHSIQNSFLDSKK